MLSTQEQATEFLERHGISAAGVDPETMLVDFKSEMEAGLAGRPSSLAMIPSFIEPQRSVPTGQPVIVIDAGGTNLRICTVTFSDDATPFVSNFSMHRMPGIEQEVSREDFYGALCEYLAPVIEESELIGFCFYPTEIQPNRDGNLLYWSKEVNVPEVVGDMIGENLLRSLRARGSGNKKMVILNDTVATLLAGKSQGERMNCGSYIGFILGTGTNTAYVEHNRRILKRNDLDADASQIINVESGNFAKGPRGDIDMAFDASTLGPGTYMLEKMISGAYLGPLCLAILRVAAAEGLLSGEAGALVSGWQDLETKDVDGLLDDPARSASPFAASAMSEQDKNLIVHIFKGVIARAALYVAINISAVAIKCGSGLDAEHPLCINIDGSTYYKANGMKEQVEPHLQAILGARRIHYVTIDVENAPVIGAAIAGLIA